METARQSRLKLGGARAAAAPWCSSRNLPLNRSAAGLLSGRIRRISLTVRNRHGISKAAACIGTHTPGVCGQPWPPPIRSKTRIMRIFQPLHTSVLAAGCPIHHPPASFKRPNRKCPGPNSATRHHVMRQGTSHSLFATSFWNARGRARSQQEFVSIRRASRLVWPLAQSA